VASNRFFPPPRHKDHAFAEASAGKHKEAQSQENKIWLFFAKADFFISSKMQKEGSFSADSIIAIRHHRIFNKVLNAAFYN
jgi:hypothetical protein